MSFCCCNQLTCNTGTSPDRFFPFAVDKQESKKEEPKADKKQPSKKKQAPPTQSEQPEKKEDALYKKLLHGGLSKQKEEKTLKEWGEAHTAFWDEEYKTNSHPIPAADSPEFYRRRMNMTEKIDRHFDELSELYPHAIN